MPTVCVFCGARDGARDVYADAADDFGREVAARGLALVYGGGRVGLMGRVADAALDLDGTVTGIIPGFLHRHEIVHEGVSENLACDDLLERKALMIERADLFVALPGGLGTFDEVLEVIAWRQLRQLRQPIGLLDVNDYFAPFRALLAHAVAEGFTGDADIAHLVYERDPGRLLDALLAQPAP